MSVVAMFLSVLMLTIVYVPAEAGVCGGQYDPAQGTSFGRCKGDPDHWDLVAGTSQADPNSDAPAPAPAVSKGKGGHSGGGRGGHSGHGGHGGHGHSGKGGK